MKSAEEVTMAAQNVGKVAETLASVVCITNKVCRVCEFEKFTHENLSNTCVNLWFTHPTLAIYTGITLTNDKTKSDKDIIIESSSKGIGITSSLVADAALMRIGAGSIARQLLSNYAGGYSENKANKSIKSKVNESNNKGGK